MTTNQCDPYADVRVERPKCLSGYCPDHNSIEDTLAYALYLERVMRDWTRSLDAWESVEPQYTEARNQLISEVCRIVREATP